MNLTNSAVERAPILTIDREELRQKLERGDHFKLLMTLNEWAFRAKHIPGSIHFNSPEQMLIALDQEDEIVVYCSNVDCIASHAAYYQLVDHGFHHVRRYAGGLIDWEEGGLPLEGEWVVTSSEPARAEGRSTTDSSEVKS